MIAAGFDPGKISDLATQIKEAHSLVESCAKAVAAAKNELAIAEGDLRKLQTQFTTAVDGSLDVFALKLTAPLQQYPVEK